MRSAIPEVDLRPSSGVRNITTPDGAVLLDIDQGLCFSMNTVGARIWELLKLNHSIDFIADTLAGDYSMSRDQILEDVRAFLAQLQGQNLIVASRKRNEASTGLLQRLFRRRSS